MLTVGATLVFAWDLHADFNVLRHNIVLHKPMMDQEPLFDVDISGQGLAAGHWEGTISISLSELEGGGRSSVQCCLGKWIIIRRICIVGDDIEVHRPLYSLPSRPTLFIKQHAPTLNSTWYPAAMRDVLKDKYGFPSFPH